MMKKKTIGLIVLAFVFCGAVTFAQDAFNLYPVHKKIIRVYSSSVGFVVSYLYDHDTKVDTVLLPTNWFTPAPPGTSQADKAKYSKAEVETINDTSAPYLIIYYNGDKIDHVRVYVRNPNDPSWGVISANDAPPELTQVKF